MRIRWVERLLAAISGLLLLLIGLAAFVFGLGILTIDPKWLANNEWSILTRVIWLAASVVIVALGVVCASFLFRHKRGHKGFIVQKTEHGDLSISMRALENMVRKCIDAHQEIRVTNTDIISNRDGIVIELKIALANGVNIPLSVNALQKQIKHYITACSGVDVTEVRVMVETANAPASDSAYQVNDLLAAETGRAMQAAPVPAPQDAVAAPSPEAPKRKGLLHQRLFRHEDTPQDLPPKPQVAAEDAGEATAAGSEDAATGSTSSTDSAVASTASAVASTASTASTASAAADAQVGAGEDAAAVSASVPDSGEAVQEEASASVPAVESAPDSAEETREIPSSWAPATADTGAEDAAEPNGGDRA